MHKVFIIAEAGVNHNGEISTAIELINVAVEAQADAVKFQTFKAKTLTSRFAPKADYQKRHTQIDESQYEMIKKLELSAKDHQELLEHCQKKGIQFLSTPFDVESARYLHGLGMKIFKIPSGEITNLPYLRVIGAFNKDVILSTGMANLDEVRNAINVLVTHGTSQKRITVLHCNTEYPTDFPDVNLKAMQTIRDTLGVAVGYSDHTLGITVPVAAAALGATIIEKHFTLDQSAEGPDHNASLNPHQLKQMVQAIREVEVSLGDGVKRCSASEAKNLAVARKSIVAARNIQAGEFLSEENLCTKRPGVGISPMEWDRVIGKRAKKTFKEDELIEL